MSVHAYQKLCAEYYDITKPQASIEEINFYLGQLQGIKPPFLEAMCGSGRLLIPLLKADLSIHGVDNSVAMLENCKNRLPKDISVELFQQSIETMDLPIKYGAIIIAVGSFQLLADRNIAFQALVNMKKHLVRGGKLLLDTFIPWEIYHSKIDHEKSRKNIKCPNGDQIILDTQSIDDRFEQVFKDLNIYKKYRKRKIIAEEHEMLMIRWYFRYEMELFLEKAGFSQIKVHRKSFLHNPDAIIYEAYA